MIVTHTFFHTLNHIMTPVMIRKRSVWPPPKETPNIKNPRLPTIFFKLKKLHGLSKPKDVQLPSFVNFSRLWTGNCLRYLQDGDDKFTHLTQYQWNTYPAMRKWGTSPWQHPEKDLGVVVLVHTWVRLAWLHLHKQGKHLIGLNNNSR